MIDGQDIQSVGSSNDRCPIITGHICIREEASGSTRDGHQVQFYTLKNRNGIALTLSSYGAAITSLKVPDRSGRSAEITLGSEALTASLDGVPYCGAIVGRFANRIAQGRFVLDGTAFDLSANEGPNHLHGGGQGFDKRIWRAGCLRTSRAPRSRSAI